MKLLLTSAGFENQKIMKKFLEIIGKPAREITVLYIITAANLDKNPYWLRWSKKKLIAVGVTEITEFDIKEVSWSEIKDYDVIYICGGNTYYLLKRIYETGFDKIIKRFISAGKVYVGESAGSYIACPTIEMATWKHKDRDRAGLEDLTALNLVPFLVTAHYEPKYEKIIADATANSRYEVKTLTDNQAILILDGQERIIE